MPLEVLIRPTLRCWGCCGTPDAQVRGGGGGLFWFVMMEKDGKRLVFSIYSKKNYD